MKIILKITFVFFFGFTSLSQKAISSEKLNADWQLIEVIDSVNIFVRQEFCESEYSEKPLHYLFVKMENTSVESKELNYSIALDYEEGCSGCDENSEFSKKVNILPHSTLTASCKNLELTRLIYNPNLEGGWTFKNVSIKLF